MLRKGMGDARDLNGITSTLVPGCNEMTFR